MSARDGTYDRTYERPDHFSNSKHYEYPHLPIALGTTLVYGVLAIAVIYPLLQYLDYPVLSIPELLWNILVYITPVRLISALDQSSQMDPTVAAEDGGLGLGSKGFAAKSDAMRRILGLDGAGLLTHFQRARSLSGISTVFKGAASDSIPGLGNWDNSCYQNSVIQGLAALPSLSAFLDKAVPTEHRAHTLSTNYALKDIITKLNDPANAGKRFWTPAELKNMSSWQQQDAQEYFSKVLDEVEKEVSKEVKDKPIAGGLAEWASLTLERPSNHAQSGTITEGSGPMATSRPLCNTSNRPDLKQFPLELASLLLRNPLEGLLAQRVGCMQCGFVEGLSLIPFNCLTVPLGKQWMYDIRSCLDDYTTLEPINGVECANCTLLRNKEQLKRLLGHASDRPAGKNQVPELSDALRKSAETRLAAVNNALEDKDFSEITLLRKCQIPAKSRVSTTKSRQAVVARAPRSLVIHVNRSVFDELTGLQSKNFADVRFPKQLDLAPWCLGAQPQKSDDEEEPEQWNVNPAESMLCDDVDQRFEEVLSKYSRMYELRAAITHYGRHENGHYICYRRHPYKADRGDDLTSKPISERWWRVSDDDVSEIDEETVLAQGGVFMLFYESIEEAAPLRLPSMAGSQEGSTTELVTDSPTSAEVQTSLEPSIIPPDTSPDVKVSHDVAQAAEASSPLVQPQPSAETSQPHQSVADASAAASTFAEYGLDNEDTTTSEPQMLAPPKPDASKENQRITTPMRTAGPRKGRGSVSRSGKGMTAVSSMVTAN